MAIPDRGKLELMPKTQEYQLKGAHRKDLERRRELMLDSVKGSIYPVTEINCNPSSPHFLNFEFFISNRKSKELDLPEGIFVMPPPCSNTERLDEIKSKDINNFSLKESISILSEQPKSGVL
jgi:hypothetical protein